MSSADTYAGIGLGGTFEVPVLKPIGEASAAEVRRWIDERTFYTHRLRARDAAMWRRAELYDAGVQWLWRAFSGYDVGGVSSQWVRAAYDKGDPNYIPTPVWNEGLPARQNESARLAAPNPRPKINPRSTRPDVTTRQGAKLGTDMNRHRLREMGWEQQSWLMYYHMPLYGGAWIKSEWDQPYDKTVMVPVQTAMACPRHKAFGDPGGPQPEGVRGECDFVLANPTVDPKAGPAPWLGSVANPTDQPVSRCPHCPDHPELQPFKPSMQEASGLLDSQGQPMGVKRPLGDWQITIKNPRDMFERDMGMSTQWGQINEWVEVATQPLDYLGARWPHTAGEVKPEKAALLAKYHPVAGAPDVMHSILDAKLFREHTRLKQWHKEPWHESLQLKSGKRSYSEDLNEGRSLVLAGDTLLSDEPFMIDSPVKPGEKVPRVHMEYVPWELRDGGLRLQGLGLWENMFDAQDSSNEARSQTQAVRQRIAVPLYAVLRAWNMRIVAARGGLPGRFAEFDPDPDGGPGQLQMPTLFNNDTIDSGVAQEMQDALSYIERVSGKVEVEKGNVPPGVQAALAIRMLKAAASEGRQPRVDRINQALKRIFQHGALLQSNMYTEPREFKFDGEDGEERWASAKGLDLEFQTDVEIEAEPSFDEKAQNQETVRALIDTGLLDPNASRLQRRKILVHMDTPKDLLEDEKLQEAAAQREWMAFRDEGRGPRVDPGLDSHGDHFEEHGNRCQTEFFRDLEERCDWDGALEILAGNWKQNLMGLAMTPELMDPNLVPMALQDRVYTFWTFQIQQNQAAAAEAPPGGKEPFMSPDVEAMEQVLLWRSHMEAHRLHEEMAQMQAQMQPTLAQPGAEETESGGQPTPGQAPEGPPA